jgi:nucleoside-diphosphate-sugar epimerase
VDLALGHLAALAHLATLEQGFCTPVNLGTGRGASVLDLVRGMETATGECGGRDARNARLLPTVVVRRAQTPRGIPRSPLSAYAHARPSLPTLISPLAFSQPTRQSGKPVPYEVVPRRPGDVASCYCDPSRAEALLGWQAERGVAEMCADAWRWQSNNPNGYKPAAASEERRDAPATRVEA